MIKYILIMQLIFDGHKAGGASIETIEFSDLGSCEAVKEVFLSDMKEKTILSTTNRQAECVETKQ